MLFFINLRRNMEVKTEKEKMLSGEPFKTGDAELMENKKNARVLA